MPRIVILFVLTLFFANCDMPDCKNTNPIFDQHAVDSKEYKAELVQQLHKIPAEKLFYWIDKYIEKDGKTFMSIFIQGPGLCAKGILDITNDSSLEYYKKQKGGGYTGAQLLGLQYNHQFSKRTYLHQCRLHPRLAINKQITRRCVTQQPNPKLRIP